MTLSRIGAVLCFVVALKSVGSAPAFAGAWPQAPGAIEVIVPFTIATASEDYDAKGKSERRNRYTKRELAPYVEYGLTKKITLVSTLALTHEETSWLGKPLVQRAISRGEAGARFTLGTWQETLFSIQPLLAFHGAESEGDPFASRRGDIDGEIDLTMGQNFKLFGMDGFTDNLIGIRVKPASRPSEVKANITIGLRPFERTMFMLKSESYASFTGGGSGAPSEVQSNKLGLSFVRELDAPVSAEICAMTSVSGRNTIKEQSVSFALWYRF